MNMIQYRTCRLPGIEVLSCRGDHVFADHIHSGDVLWLNCGGSEQFRVQGNSAVLQPGWVSLIAAGVVHANQPCSTGSRDLRSLYLSDAFWRGLACRLELPSLHPPQLGIQEVNDPRLCQDVATWHAALFEDEETLMLEQGMLMVFTRLIKEAGRLDARHRIPRERNPRLERMLDYLHAGLSGKITLKELSEIGQCSQMHVLRLFKGGLGITPHGYLVQIRLEHARNRLQAGKAVVEAALETGFADQSHLHRAFVRRYGITPAQYRRQAVSTQAGR